MKTKNEGENKMPKNEKSLKTKQKRIEPPRGRQRLMQSLGERMYTTDGDASFAYAENDVRFRRWSAVYLGTAVAAILMVCLLLLSGSVSEYALRTGSFWGRGAQGLAALFLEQDFMDMSVGRDLQKEQEDVFVGVEGILLPDRGGISEENDADKNDEEPTEAPLNRDTLYAYDYSAVPSGQTPIVPMNLALSSYGNHYIHNDTGYSPDTAKLLAGSLKQNVDFENLSQSGSPMVLIVHTHATEGYSEDGAIYCDDDAENFARSKDSSKNMLAIGRALQDELQDLGIASVHCTVLHDEVQYKDSYRRSEESIRQYLEKYPTIRLVIDLHRDAVIKSNGDVVRPVTLYEGKAVAQLMCVVGSNWNGSAHENWEQNLALSLKLRELLNATCTEICRPTHLKASTYNQELAPYSLLIEAGACGNSLEEVKRSMSILAKCLRELLPQM